MSFHLFIIKTFQILEDMTGQLVIDYLPKIKQIMNFK